jgi:metal-dependent amidase/aminoacylase/carboxypeptidase family protein
MILSELRNELTGTYKLIFQPSEEKMPSGAAAMIAEGVLLNPKSIKCWDGMYIPKCRPVR